MIAKMRALSYHCVRCLSAPRSPVRARVYRCCERSPSLIGPLSAEPEVSTILKGRQLSAVSGIRYRVGRGTRRLPLPRSAGAPSLRSPSTRLGVFFSAATLCTTPALFRCRGSTPFPVLAPTICSFGWPRVSRRRLGASFAEVSSFVGQGAPITPVQRGSPEVSLGLMSAARGLAREIILSLGRASPVQRRRPESHSPARLMRLGVFFCPATPMTAQRS